VTRETSVPVTQGDKNNGFFASRQNCTCNRRIAWYWTGHRNSAGGCRRARPGSLWPFTAVIARGIGKPELRYVQFPYDQMQQALEQVGMPPKKAAVYIEMFTAIDTGVLEAHEPRSPQNSTPTSFETFVQDVFAPAYRGKATTA
jgi:hypothetical protein